MKYEVNNKLLPQRIIKKLEPCSSASARIGEWSIRHVEHVADRKEWTPGRKRHNQRLHLDRSRTPSHAHIWSISWTEVIVMKQVVLVVFFFNFYFFFIFLQVIGLAGGRCFCQVSDCFLSSRSGILTLFKHVCSLKLHRLLAIPLKFSGIKSHSDKSRRKLTLAS